MLSSIIRDNTTINKDGIVIIIVRVVTSCRERESFTGEKNYRIGVKKNKNNEAEGERHVKSYTRIL